MTDEYELGRQFGELNQAVVMLTAQVKILGDTVDKLNAQMNRGKGFAYGLLFAAGGVGAAITTALSRLFPHSG